MDRIASAKVLRLGRGPRRLDASYEVVLGNGTRKVDRSQIG